MRWGMSVAMVPPEELAGLVRLAEQVGFDFVSLPDSVFYPQHVSGGYPFAPDGKRMWAPETPMPDPLVTVAALAAVTTRIRFQTNVLKLPLRAPLLLAKQVATLAVLSDDRLSLGVGVSWMPEEFRFTRTDMRTRGARTDEAIEILRLVCGGSGPAWVEHHGRHYDFDRLMVSPAPARPVSILVGGHSDAALRRAARLGDGWVAANVPLAELEAALDRLAELRRAEQRPEDRPEDRPFSVCVAPVGIGDADGFRHLESAGVTDVYLAPWRLYGHAHGDRAARLESVRRFAAEVIDRC
ncbi:TIGR03619 family F420-dependent LLM class oxidoreductase [Nocardioides sp. CCNWLW239]|uniref:TIGR03619 family F420-dependent LLM class oxidoreductase n=1 Tax=Nocardioides sp. CCNWLW239 TaxID=3128902 RepID=UPI003015A7C4